MKDLKKLLATVAKQEATLQFEQFSMATAHEIGLVLLDRAKAEEMPVAIDITRHGHQLFHVALEGSMPDNDQWIKRKMAVVNRFSHSSFYMSLDLEIAGKTIEEACLLDEATYAPHGGAFPIILKGTGVIGAIAVSGLASDEDHQMVVDAVAKYLGAEVPSVI